MKYAALFAAVSLSVLATGCAGLADMPESRIRAASDSDVCHSYARAKNDKVRRVVEERGLIRADNRADIDAYRLKIGYTEMEVVCTKGQPDRINERVSAAGTDRQFVYRWADGKTSYIHTENGRVTSFSGW